MREHVSRNGLCILRSVSQLMNPVSKTFILQHSSVEAGGLRVQPQPELQDIPGLKKNRSVVVHTFNPIIQQAEAEGSLRV